MCREGRNKKKGRWRKKMEEEATEARSAHAPCVEPNRMCFLPVPAAAAASKGSSLHMFFNSERVW